MKLKRRSARLSPWFVAFAPARRSCSSVCRAALPVASPRRMEVATMNNDHAYSGEDFSVRGTSSVVTGFVVGAVIGAGLALLLAPATGTDTRRKLGDVARKVRD